MSRGGRRSGKPGGQYANRSDLRSPNLPKVGPSQVYGESAALQQALKAVPAAGAPQQPAPSAPSAPSSGVGPGPAQQPPAAMAGGSGDLFAPTDQPDTPLTAGVGQPAFGPPPPLTAALAALNTVPTSTPELRQLRAQLGAAQSNMAAP